MRHLIQKILVFTLFLCLSPLFGQEFSTGAILDRARYEQVPLKQTLLTRNYTNLPRTISLRQYAPIPESQGPFGTCAAWSTAFAARTISESIFLNRNNQEQSNNNAFSPAYVYINASGDPTFKRGMTLGDALEFMKNTGAVRRSSTERTLGSANYMSINLLIYSNAQRYTISEYVRLFYDWGIGTIEEKVLPVKKSLSENKPVIIAMKLPPSFFNTNGMWQPYENPNQDTGSYHGMCVVGYDDDTHSGAFLVQNSWGTNWGDNGYVWIRYTDFANWVWEAYEIIENLANYRDATRFSASIEIELYDSNRGMPVTFDRQGFYKTRSSYPSGTQFRFLMTNRYPAYVYAFSADSNTSKTDRIFPKHGISPVLDYSDSTIAWPGEYGWMQLDDVTGTDYLVVLYSKYALDIDAIERRFASESGTFPERVAKAVGSNFIPYSNVNYIENKIEFGTVSINPRAVFGLLLAIDHR
jgi:hypothetical protein